MLNAFKLQESQLLQISVLTDLALQDQKFVSSLMKKHKYVLVEKEVNIILVSKKILSNQDFTTNYVFHNSLQGHLRRPLARPSGLKRHSRGEEAFKEENFSKIFFFSFSKF